MVNVSDFNWWNVIPTVAGGLISIATTVVMFNVGQISERRKKAIEKRKADAFSAFSGFHKLLAIANNPGNITIHIDEIFTDAQKKGAGDLELYQKFTPLVGASREYLSVSMNELYFLAEVKASKLMGDIDLIYHRARNIDATLNIINKLKIDFLKFAEERGKSIELPIDGQMAVTMSSHDANLANMRADVLQRMLGDFMELLERDYPESKRVCEAFLATAQKHFGDDFPKVKLEWAN